MLKYSTVQAYGSSISLQDVEMTNSEGELSETLQGIDPDIEENTFVTTLLTHRHGASDLVILPDVTEAPNPVWNRGFVRD